MANGAALPGIGRLTIAQKLILLSGGVAVVIAAIVSYTVLAVQSQRSASVVIDLAGRQRMLTQRFVKEVVLKDAGQAVRPEETLNLFDDTLAALIKGGLATENLETGAKIELPRTDLPGALESLEQQRELLDRIRAETAIFLRTPAGDSAKWEALDSVVNSTNRLLREANELVKRLSEQAERRVDALIFWEILIAVVAIAGGTILSLLLARSISRPLQACVERANDIAEGNLAVSDLPVNSRDELGRLSGSFNQMVEGLRMIARNTREVTEELNSAAAEILATTQQQASGTKQQAAAVQEITSTVDEINQSGSQVSERARNLSSTSQAMTTAGEQGLQAVQAISKAMGGIHQQAQSVAENIVTLSERTQAIGEIIATVNDIAEQSNLVALNAAIEAADARGEGRRFSVVAGEIKNLADQAKDATGQVRSILEEIQRGINTSVMLTEEAVKRVEYGRDKTGLAEETMTKMSVNVQESANAFQQIVGATNQQQIGLEQVAQALQEIRQATQQTASSTGQLNQAASSLNSLARQLRDQVEKYRV